MAQAQEQSWWDRYFGPKRSLQEEWAERRRGGLLNPFSVYAPFAESLGQNWRNFQSTQDLIGQALMENLFTGLPQPTVSAEGMSPSAQQNQMAASLGMASPTYGMPSGSLEGMMGYPKEEEKKEPGYISGGFLQKYPEPPKWEDIEGPDFSKAFERLGKEPTATPGPSKMEQLARVLGGASQGAMAGLHPAYAQTGSSAAAVLAGAGGGSGAIVGQIAREEQARQREFFARRERYRARSAELEATAQNAKSRTEQFNAAGKRWEATIAHQSELADLQRRAPKVQVLDDGMILVTTVGPNDEIQYRQVDFLEDYRQDKLALAWRIAAQKGEIYLGGKATIPINSVSPQFAQLIRTSQERLDIDPGFRAKVIEYMEQKTNLKFEDLAAQVISGVGATTFEDLKIQMVFAGVELLGMSAAEMEAELSGAGQQMPGLGIER